MTRPACESCQWWQQLDPYGESMEACGGYAVTDFGTGLCRRMPPWLKRQPDLATDSADAAAAAIWPVTWDEDWCGEHRVRHPLVPDIREQAGASVQRKRNDDQ